MNNFPHPIIHANIQNKTHKQKKVRFKNVSVSKYRPNSIHKRKFSKKKKIKQLKNNALSLNCSPYMKNKKIANNTCYDKHILLKIRDAFNEQPEYSNVKIISSKPNRIIEELREKMADKCLKEDCWLSLLSNKEQNMIEEIVFAPKKPIEWKKNPTEWLSNHDILKVLKQYEKSNPHFKFIGPTPIDFDSKPNNDICVWDDLCKFSLQKYIDLGIKKIGVIFNLDKHNQKGSHWVSMFIDIDESFIFYFDSASNKTPNEIKTFVERIQNQHSFKYYENYPNAHQKSNTECGMYSLYFIITMLSYKPSNTIRLFKNKKISDAKMIQLRDKYFNS